MGALTDDYENKVHADCEQLYTVLKNCDAPGQQESDAQSIKALYRLVFLLSHRQGSKMMAITTTTASYLCHHPMLPVILVEILRDSKNIKVCAYVLDILAKLVVKNAFVSETDRKAARRAFYEPQHFRTVIQALRNIDARFQPAAEVQQEGGKDLPSMKGYDMQVRFLKIINCMYSRKGQSQISLVTDFTVEFLSRHFVKHAEINKEISRCMLPLIKTICRNRRNCEIVCTEFFATALVTLVPQVNRYPTGISILRFLSRSPGALIEISQLCVVYQFVVRTAIYHSEKSTHRKYLMSALYRLAKTSYGIQLLKNTSLWSLLLEFFMKSERLEELRQRMSFTRAYTILHRGVPNKFLQTCPLQVQFEFSGDIQRYINNRANHQSSDDSDNDDNEEEDEDEKGRCKAVSVENENNEIENDDDDVDDSDGEHEPDKKKSEDKCEISKEREENILQNDVLHNGAQLNDFARFFSEFSEANSVEYNNFFDATIYRHPLVDRLALPDLLPHVDTEDDGCLTPNINIYSPDELSTKLLTLKNYRSPLQPNVVYDLDTLIKEGNYDVTIPDVETVHMNYINKRPNPKQDIGGTLKFESRFECGNLRRAEQMDAYEYNLFLSPDINMSCGLQWFYFQVSGMTAQKTYVFNIVNFQKCNSQFSYGLQPAMFSILGYALHSRGWHKCGSQLMYYGNEYLSRESNKQFRTLRFCVTFDYDEDVCYFAYHYPYTYTRLMKVALATLSLPPDDVLVRVDELSKSIGGLNPVVLITITGRDINRIGLDKRQFVFLTARVHPGESNASWIIEGATRYLLTGGEGVKTALERFIFKIIPILNPEGVIYGNTRCTLTGNDLNRCWKKPHPRLHPEVYNAKKLVEYAREHLTNEIFTFIDIHGHSRKKFFFLYGCNARQSWNDMDAILSDPEDTCNTLAAAMSTINSNMKLAYCKNTIERKRETTCRVVMWRDFAIRRSHTLECSFCSGDNKKKITTGMLLEIGETIVKALANQVIVDGASNARF